MTTGIAPLFAFLTQFLALGLALFTAYREAKAKAAADQIAFDLDQAAFHGLIRAVLDKSQASAPANSAGDNAASDAADADKKKS